MFWQNLFFSNSKEKSNDSILLEKSSHQLCWVLVDPLKEERGDNDELEPGIEHL